MARSGWLVAGVFAVIGVTAAGVGVAGLWWWHDARERAAKETLDAIRAEHASLTPPAGCSLNAELAAAATQLNLDDTTREQVERAHAGDAEALEELWPTLERTDGALGRLLDASRCAADPRLDAGREMLPVSHAILLAAARARAHHLRGDREGAVRWLLDVWRLGLAMQRDLSGLGFAVGGSAVDTATEGLLEVLDGPVDPVLADEIEQLADATPTSATGCLAAEQRMLERALVAPDAVDAAHARARILTEYRMLEPDLRAVMRQPYATRSEAWQTLEDGLSADTRVLVGGLRYIDERTEMVWTGAQTARVQARLRAHEQTRGSCPGRLEDLGDLPDLHWTYDPARCRVERTSGQ